MCTLAWGEAEEGAWICFNRDEARTRTPARPPERHQHGERALLYPVDPDGGGTWITASSNREVVVLLNHYPAEPPALPDCPRSRGKLVLDLAASGRDRDLRSRICSHSLVPYPPFHVFIFREGLVQGLTWDGRKVKETGFSNGIFTTSSHQPEAVSAWRNAYWNRMHEEGRISSPEAAAGLLRRVEPGKPAFGPTMDRDDARTVSQILLVTDQNGFVMCYRERDPQGNGYLPPVQCVMNF